MSTFVGAEHPAPFPSMIVVYRQEACKDTENGTADAERVVWE